MNKTVRQVSVALENAYIALNNSASALENQEKSDYQGGKLSLFDETLTLKTAVGSGDIVDLLNIQKNKDFQVGINDYQDARIVRKGAGGSIVINRLRLMVAVGDGTAIKPEQQTYDQTSWPSDLQNSELHVKVGTETIKRVKLSEFVFTGDAPQTLEDQYKTFEVPFVLPAGKVISYEIHRPVGLQATPNTFISIETKGYQLQEVKYKS